MIVATDFNFYLHLAQLVIGLITIFFGRKLHWLWIGFLAFLLGERIVSFALFRDTDLLRFSSAAGAGLILAVLAVRFRRVAVVVGGFLAAGLLAVTVFGRFLPIVPIWLALTLLVGAGIPGAVFAWRRPELALIWLSAIWGSLAGVTLARMFTRYSPLLDVLAFLILASAGIWVQMRQWRRETAPASAQEG
jgi:hypothetical protein